MDSFTFLRDIHLTPPMKLIDTFTRILCPVHSFVTTIPFLCMFLSYMCLLCTSNTGVVTVYVYIWLSSYMLFCTRYSSRSILYGRTYSLSLYVHIALSCIIAIMNHHYVLYTHIGVRNVSHVFDTLQSISASESAKTTSVTLQALSA